MGLVAKLRHLKHRAFVAAKRRRRAAAPARPDLVAAARAAHPDAVEGTVVALGDSLAERAPWSAMIGQAVAHRGYGGMLISEVTTWAAETLGPGLEQVVLWVGTNDAMEARPRDEVRTDLEALFRTITTAAPGVHVAALTLPPLGTHQEQVRDHAELLEHLAAQYPVTVVDVTDVLRAPGALIGDGVHVSGRGYDLIAPLVRAALPRRGE